jgi:hypothetical protein
VDPPKGHLLGGSKKGKKNNENISKFFPLALPKIERRAELTSHHELNMYAFKGNHNQALAQRKSLQV